MYCHFLGRFLTPGTNKIRSISVIRVPTLTIILAAYPVVDLAY